MGFTLIEMMVVIGIIAILSSFVVPGFKKAYDDFKLRESLDYIDTTMSALRSFYLIHNEGSLQSYSGTRVMEKRLLSFLPSNWRYMPYPYHEVHNSPILYADFYYPPPFAKLYKGDASVFDIWDLVLNLTAVSEKYEYLEDLTKMCKQKGYGWQSRVYNGRENIHVYLLEKADKNNISVLTAGKVEYFK